MAFPINVKSRWPETILAIKRILKVPGRIKVLIDSIKTIKLIKGIGVLKGTKWASILFEKIIQPYKKKPIHNGTEKNKLNIKCLEGVKKLGNKPKKLQNKIIKKILEKYIWVPSFIDFKAIENCLFRDFKKLSFIISIREGKIQKE